MSSAFKMAQDRNADINALRRMTESVTDYGETVMAPLNADEAARLALYLLDQAGMSVDDQTQVLEMLKRGF